MRNHNFCSNLHVWPPLTTPWGEPAWQNRSAVATGVLSMETAPQVLGSAACLLPAAEQLLMSTTIAPTCKWAFLPTKQDLGKKINSYRFCSECRISKFGFCLYHMFLYFHEDLPRFVSVYPLYLLKSNTEKWTCSCMIFKLIYFRSLSNQVRLLKTQQNLLFALGEQLTPSRLDFDNLVTAAPPTSGGNLGSCPTGTDFLTVTSPTGASPPVVCGTLTGQHSTMLYYYVDN